MTASIKETLQERGSNYGEFNLQAKISQQLKQFILAWESNRDYNFYPHQREALEMICHKLARIVNGNPHYADSWRDIAGYAMLVAEELEKKD